MKTTIVTLAGDPAENLYQLGLKERDSFLEIERRVANLLSQSELLKQGYDFINRARLILKKKEDSFFDQCIKSYAEGLGVDIHRYQSFLSLFELAAHHGHTYPELKSLLPGCTSLFAKNGNEITHSRLLDFPLIGLYEEKPRLYYWKPEGKPSLLTMSCEGLAPLFLQGIHGSGISFALHHKPGKTFHREGQGIFQIMFESMFEAANFNELKKELKRKVSVTKWSVMAVESEGHVFAIDIDGPAQNIETYNLGESNNLIFTNIPLQKDSSGFETYMKFSEDRQSWLKNKMPAKDIHPLDLMTNVEDQKAKTWKHPAATLSTVGAYHINLSKGLLDLKEGTSALTQSDAILRFNLGNANEKSELRPKSKESGFESAWKRAARAQALFDQKSYDEAYHELQMGIGLMPNKMWKEIFSFYLVLWDFKFVSNPRELSLIYKKAKSLTVPEILKDQWIFLIMRMEKKLDLSSTVNFQDVSVTLQPLFKQEKLANKPLFATWMKLIYPRMEILDVFSPHNR